MVDKHFFKPLLPGFHSHLTIPVAFFSKHIEGRNEQTTARLRSDASKKTWEVQIEDGQKLTDGWKDFASAHDLRIGDILIFRQEKDMAFHVTLLGPSCCEIQYGSYLEDENNLENIRKNKNARNETGSSASLDLSSFVSNVAPSTLHYDRLYLPMSFTRANGLGTRCGEIVLMNEKSRSWTLILKRQRSSRVMYITRGWRSFCCANGLNAGDSFTFKLIQGGTTLVLRLSSTESKEEEENSSEDDEVECLSIEPERDNNLEKIQRKKNPKRDAESFSLEPSCYVAYVTPSGLRDDRLILRRSFVMENDLEERCGEIVLMNKKGRSWTLNLNRNNACGTMSITGGWRSFCRANGLKAGSFFTFKLSQTGGTLVLRLSSQYQNRFVTLTLRPYNIKNYFMFLPVRFTKMHGINEETKMTMLDKNGVKWSTDLRSSNRGNRIRLVGGWQEFFKANCVKTGKSIIVKLIWEGDTSCVLKFCSKVNHETK